MKKEIDIEKYKKRLERRYTLLGGLLGLLPTLVIVPFVPLCPVILAVPAFFAALSSIMLIVLIPATKVDKWVNKSISKVTREYTELPFPKKEKEDKVLEDVITFNEEVIPEKNKELILKR